MKPYIIHGFRHNRGGAIFERQTTGPHAAKYLNTSPNSDEVLHGMQFICNGNFTINSIIRQTTGARNNEVVQQIFRVGERYATTSVAGDMTPIVVLSFALIDSDRVEVHGAGVTVLLTDLQPIPERQNGRRGAVVTPVEAQPVTPVLNNGNFFEQLEAQIIAANPRAMRLEKTLKNRGTQTLPNFLKQFFSDYNKTRRTVYVDNPLEEQCDTGASIGRRRSIGDIFMICRYYFPECTLQEVVVLLCRTLPAEVRGFRTSYCTTINRRVWYVSQNDPTQVLNNDRVDEFGNVYRAYLDNI